MMTFSVPSPAKLKPYRILGVDPGSYNMGLGCIEKTGQKLKLIHAEVLKAPRSQKLYARLQHLLNQFFERLATLRPDEVAIEDAFYGKNARSAFHLGLARGTVISACLQKDLSIEEYAPTQVKSIVTGYGRADKDQVKKMTQLTLGAQIDEGYDATDALAVAICHSHSSIKSRFAPPSRIPLPR